MTLPGFLVQVLNGLADASSLFLVAVGLSLIFGVSRIVNFAHGSLYMLGIYLAYSLVQTLNAYIGWGFWLSLLVVPLVVGLLGAIIEIVILRRIYQAPELFQLLATFALVLIINDAVLWYWGPEDLLGPLAPGLSDSIILFERHIPEYDLFLVVLGPLVLFILWWMLARTQWGALLRAATQDRHMLAALGINQSWLFTAVFALGAGLAGLAGALQLPRQPANLGMDLNVIAQAFVVVVVGGMGSIPGAFIAALLIALLKAVCIALGTVVVFGVSVHFPSFTLVAEFALMAVVLVFRPWGLLGHKPALTLHSKTAEQAPLYPLGRKQYGAFVAFVVVLSVLPWLGEVVPYASVVALDIILAVIFALSLYLLMGPAGMISFGHAAYFGLGAYAAALLFKTIGVGMLGSIFIAPFAVALFAALFGWFCVRLSGVYLAMLTLAFAQIIWTIVYQWDSLTGGSNGIIGIWPAAYLSGPRLYFFILLVMVVCAWGLERILFSPFGMAMRAGRDSPLRAQALGINVGHVQWLVFVLSGVVAGVAGALFVFSKGGTSPEVLSIAKSVDVLVMVLLGGVQQVLGPFVGATVFQLLDDFFTGITAYWHALFGAVILMLVLLFPGGLLGRRRHYAGS